MGLLLTLLLFCAARRAIFSYMIGTVDFRSDNMIFSYGICSSDFADVTENGLLPWNIHLLRFLSTGDFYSRDT